VPSGSAPTWRQGQPGRGPRISAAGSSVSASAIPTDEELMIVEHAVEVITCAV
jgi:hypothetical protein